MSDHPALVTTSRTSMIASCAGADRLKVLLVEDEQDIATNIWDFLERRGCVVDHAADGSQGLMRAIEGEFDVIVLDLGLPRLDGLTLCRRLRAAGRSMPVLMLTARDTLEDSLSGFAHGTDDYLVKPFAMRELEVRIRALHRRRQPAPGATLRVEDLSYSLRSMLAERAGRSIALTVTHGHILSVLMRESPSVVRREALMRKLWGEEGGSFAALHTHVCALRSLIDRPFDTALLHTVHGVGYRLGAT